jgi:hypothetical protein
MLVVVEKMRRNPAENNMSRATSPMHQYGLYVLENNLNPYKIIGSSIQKFIISMLADTNNLSLPTLTLFERDPT